MAINWSDAILALAAISKAMTREDLERSILAACIDAIGVARACLVTQPNGGTDRRLRASQIEMGEGGIVKYSNRDFDDSQSAIHDISAGSHVQIPLGQSMPSAALYLWWRAAGHPTADEQMLLAMIAGTGFDCLQRLPTMPIDRPAASVVAAAATFPVESEDRQSQRMEAVGRLTATLTHDISNLLAPIMTSLELIARSVQDDHRTQEHLHVAMQATTSAQALLRQMLQFFRNQPDHPAAVAPQPALTEMAQLLSMTVGPDIRLHVIVPPDLPDMLVDKKQLEAALMNLVANARDAMPDGGDLILGASFMHECVRANQRQEFVRLFVKDNGVGMTQEVKARALAPFYTTKAPGSGTGLGLPMVQDMVDRAGGYMEIDTSPKMGTEVSLWIPVAPSHAQQFANLADKPVTKEHALLFVVDDHGLVRKGIGNMLREDGYRVVELDSALACLAHIDQGTIPDVIISDHIMPGMNGLALARQLEQTHPTIPFLLISAFDSLEQMPRTTVKMSKPFRYPELVAGIRNARLMQKCNQPGTAKRVAG